MRRSTRLSASSSRSRRRSNEPREPGSDRRGAASRRYGCGRSLGRSPEQLCTSATALLVRRGHSRAEASASGRRLGRPARTIGPCADWSRPRAGHRSRPRAPGGREGRCHDESPAAWRGLHPPSSPCEIRTSSRPRARMGPAPGSGPPSAFRSGAGCRTGRAARSRCRRSAPSAPR